MSTIINSQYIAYLHSIGSADSADEGKEWRKGKNRGIYRERERREER